MAAADARRARARTPPQPAQAARAAQGRAARRAAAERASGPIVRLAVRRRAARAAGVFAPRDFAEHLTVFLLACFVGWQVIWNVTPALHTPLMSVTNAISGIILVGGMLSSRTAASTRRRCSARVAVLFATINVAGGFLVTQRMLRMFREAPSRSSAR